MRRQPAEFGRGRVLLAAMVLALAGTVVPPVRQEARAQESLTDDAPAPDSVNGLDTPMEAGFAAAERKPPRFPRLKRTLQNLPPFFSDASLVLKPRNYYFYRDNFDRSRNQAYAMGGSVAFESGWFMDRVKLGGEFFTSQKLYGPLDRDGTDLLAKGQRHYNVLGQAYGILKLAELHKVSVFRQEYDLPFVNKNDSRMTPNTFEGYSVQGRFDRKGKRPRVEYIGGYIAKIKQRNADAFISMAEAAGAGNGVERGTLMAGVRVAPTENLALGAIDFFTPDVLNIFYVEGSYKREITKELSLRLKGQFTDQRSVGSDLLTGSSFETHVGGAELSASYRSAVLRAAFSVTSDGADIMSPFGTYPGYLGLMQSDFDSAGETAWLLGLSFDFKRVGLDGLSAFASFASGRGIVDPGTRMSLPDEREIDVTVDYKLPEGRFRGFWVRLRGAYLDEAGMDDWSREYRIILNYEIPLL